MSDDRAPTRTSCLTGHVETQLDDAGRVESMYYYDDGGHRWGSIELHWDVGRGRYQDRMCGFNWDKGTETAVVANESSTKESEKTLAEWVEQMVRIFWKEFPPV